MHTIKINNIDYNIPMSWNELTYSQAIKVVEHVNDKGKQLEAVTNIPIEIIDKLIDQQVQVLFSLISFTENLEVFESDTILEWAKDFDFGSISYGDAETCRKMLASEKNGWEAIIPLIKHLKQIDISEMPFLEVIGTANFFLTKSIVFMIVTPSLTKFKQVMNSSKLELSDFLASKALERTLKLQGLEL